MKLGHHRKALMAERTRWQDKADRCHHLLGRFSLHLTTTVAQGKERRRLNKWMTTLHRCHRHIDRLTALLSPYAKSMSFVAAEAVHSGAFVIITQGEFKAAQLAAQGLPAIAVPGRS